jgi:hypothetical protein
MIMEAVDQAAGNITCERCGTTIPRALAKPTAVRIVDDGDFELASFCCSGDCVSAASAATLMSRVHCVGFGCAEQVQRPAGVGRPRVYCSEKCRRHTKTVLDDAVRKLALSSYPRESDPERKLAALDEDIARAEFLRACWSGGSPYLPGREYPELPKPARGAVRALSKRVVHLNHLRRITFEGDVLSAREAAVEAKREKSWAKVFDLRRADDQRWRDELLGKVGSREADSEDRSAVERAEAEADAIRKAERGRRGTRTDRPGDVEPDGWGE